MPAKGNLAIYQGDDYAALVTVSDGVTPPAQILSGYTAKAQIRADVADDADVAVEITTQVASPNISLYISSSDTVEMCGNYVWDLQITDPSGLVTTILAGTVQVTEEVTR